jgi:hypothetical protein
LVEETYNVEFDESNGSQGAIENCDDVGNEPLREATKNMPVGDIKPKDDEDDVQVINLLLHQMCRMVMTKMRELKMKILMYLMNKPWHKHKMLMLPNLLLKWLIEDIHLYFKLIHKISS